MLQQQFLVAENSLCVTLVLSVSPYVRFQLIVQNVVFAQPCVGKLEISLVLLNSLGCIVDGDLKLPKLLIHTLVMLQK